MDHSKLVLLLCSWTAVIAGMRKRFTPNQNHPPNPSPHCTALSQSGSVSVFAHNPLRLKCSVSCQHRPPSTTSLALLSSLSCLLITILYGIASESEQGWEECVLRKCGEFFQGRVGCADKTQWIKKHLLLDTKWEEGRNNSNCAADRSYRI